MLLIRLRFFGIEFISKLYKLDNSLKLIKMVFVHQIYFDFEKCIKKFIN